MVTPLTPSPFMSTFRVGVGITLPEFFPGQLEARLRVGIMARQQGNEDPPRPRPLP